MQNSDDPRLLGAADSHPRCGWQTACVSAPDRFYGLEAHKRPVSWASGWRQAGRPYVTGALWTCQTSLGTAGAAADVRRGWTKGFQHCLLHFLMWMQESGKRAFHRLYHLWTNCREHFDRSDSLYAAKNCSAPLSLAIHFYRVKSTVSMGPVIHQRRRKLCMCLSAPWQTL